MLAYSPLNIKKLIIVSVYLDKFLLEFKSYNILEWLKNELIKEFQIKDLGKAKIIIKWGIIRDLKAKTLKLIRKDIFKTFRS